MLTSVNPTLKKNLQEVALDWFFKVCTTYVCIKKKSRTFENNKIIYFCAVPFINYYINIIKLR